MIIKKLQKPCGRVFDRLRYNNKKHLCFPWPHIEIPKKLAYTYIARDKSGNSKLP